MPPGPAAAGTGEVGVEGVEARGGQGRQLAGAARQPARAELDGPREELRAGSTSRPRKPVRHRLLAAQAISGPARENHRQRGQVARSAERSAPQEAEHAVASSHAWATSKPAASAAEPRDGRDDRARRAYGAAEGRWPSASDFTLGAGRAPAAAAEACPGACGTPSRSNPGRAARAA